MRVGRDDVSHLQIVLREDLLHPLDLVAGIDDDRFFGCVIAHHRAVARQHADR